MDKTVHIWSVEPGNWVVKVKSELKPNVVGVIGLIVTWRFLFSGRHYPKQTKNILYKGCSVVQIPQEEDTASLKNMHIFISKTYLSNVSIDYFLHYETNVEL